MKYQIHRAISTDIRPALELVERVWIEFDLPDMDNAALETMQHDITRNEDMIEKYTSGKSTMFIAMDGEKTVGAIGADNDGYIRLLFVDGAYHRQGIATELLSRMVCELKLRGFAVIRLNSSRHGLPFYRKFGFIQVAAEKKLNGFLSTPMEYTPNEIWDVLDENGNRTGRYHERGRPMAAGYYHLVVNVWKHNGRGEWLIDRRANRGGNLDGKWETTGGSAIAGDDSLTAALRETKEELGIDLDPRKGALFNRVVRHGDNGHTWIQDAWIFEHDCAIEAVRFQDRETCDAMWATADQIREMMAAGEFLSEWFYPYFNEMAEQWGVKKDS